jgi:hypothetical protein
VCLKSASRLTEDCEAIVTAKKLAPLFLPTGYPRDETLNLLWHGHRSRGAGREFHNREKFRVDAQRDGRWTVNEPCLFRQRA